MNDGIKVSRELAKKLLEEVYTRKEKLQKKLAEIQLTITDIECALIRTSEIIQEQLPQAATPLPQPVADNEVPAEYKARPKYKQ